MLSRVTEETGFRMQDSGFRIQVSGALLNSIMNYELLRSTLVPAAAYGVCGEFEMAGSLARAKVYDKMSPPTEEGKTSKFKK